MGIISETLSGDTPVDPTHIFHQTTDDGLQCLLGASSRYDDSSCIQHCLLTDWHMMSSRIVALVYQLTAMVLNILKRTVYFSKPPHTSACVHHMTQTTAHRGVNENCARDPLTQHHPTLLKVVQDNSLFVAKKSNYSISPLRTA